MKKNQKKLKDFKLLTKAEMKKIMAGTQCYACSKTDWGFGCPNNGCYCFGC